MKPITREEQYLNRLTGEEGIIPDKPVTREEQYFARLCGGDNVIPDKPVTRREQYLATLCGEDVITPTKPVTRIEQYMAFASGESESKPEKPITREEMYWDKYQGGDVPEEKTIAFTDIITVTDALARAAVDLQTEITATQNLNGYEYPWVGGAGVNKFAVGDAVGVPSGYAYGLTVSIDANAETIRIHGTASWSTSSAKQFRLLSTKENGTYGDAPATHDYSGMICTPFVVNKSSNINSVDRVIYNATEGTLSIVVNTTADKETDITLHIAITEGSTAPSAWTPYENICPITGRNTATVYHGATEQTAVAITTALGQTVYGGTLDVTTGVLTVDKAIKTVNDLTWNYNATYKVFYAYISDKKIGRLNVISDSYRTVDKYYTSMNNGEISGTTIDNGMNIKDTRFNNLNDFKSEMADTQLVYELATPTTISLTPTEVMMLKNNNTIWADAGRVQLTYLSKAAERVRSMNASLKANTLKLTKGAIK